MKLQRALLLADANPYSLMAKINFCIGLPARKVFPDLPSYLNKYKIQGVASITWFEQEGAAVIVFEMVA